MSDTAYDPAAADLSEVSDWVALLKPRVISLVVLTGACGLLVAPGHLPVALAGLLISIEPLIDMGRTALNVSGSITAGTVASRALGLTDRRVFERDDEPGLDSEQQTA